MLQRICFAGLLISIIGINTCLGQAEPASEPDVGPQDTAEPAAPVESAPELDKGDTAWMLVSTAFVLMMTCPGLALFYGGLVRKKNIVSVLMQCVFLMGLMSIVWALWGYSFAFGGSNPYYGSFTQHFALSGVVPHTVDGVIVIPQSRSIHS